MKKETYNPQEATEYILSDTSRDIGEIAADLYAQHVRMVELMQDVGAEIDETHTFHQVADGVATARVGTQRTILADKDIEIQADAAAKWVEENYDAVVSDARNDAAQDGYEIA